MAEWLKSWGNHTPQTSGSPAVLLVHPLGQIWCETNGAALAEPPPANRPVVIVADLIEETHVQIDVPAIGGKDRQSFVQIQMETLLPETPFKAIWQAPSAWPFLPKPFSLNATGISSPALQQLVEEQIAQERPIVGVWSLSHLMTRWSATQKNQTAQPWVVLAFAQAHGLRMVLLQNGVPVFSRLLFDSYTSAQELAQTIKYLQDNRVLDRDLQPPIVVLQAPDGFESALQAQGLTLLPKPPASASKAAPLIWPELVKLAQKRAPGQMAKPEERRFYLAQQMQSGLRWGSALLIAGLLWGVYAQAHAVWNRLQETTTAQRQSVEMTQQAQTIQQGITASGVDTGVMRLAIEVQRQELEHGIALLSPFWMLGQLLEQQPQARLNKFGLALQTQACGTPDPNAPPVGAGDGATLQTEWTFEIWPEEDTSPRERQRLLEELARATANWKNWTVKVNPVQEAAVAPIAVEQAGAAAPPSAWRWCLAEQTQEATSTSAGLIPQGIKP